MGANTKQPERQERVRNAGISDSQLDAVLAMLEKIEPHGNLALRDGIANLKEARETVPARVVQVGDRIRMGVVDAVTPYDGGVTFRVLGSNYSYNDHHELRVERDGVVL
jgi:hypothetical protein